MSAQIKVLVVASLVTILIRALPFMLGPRLTKSRFLQKFSDVLTPALIGMLVVYCLKDVSFHNNTGIASAVGVTLCVLTYLWKRNTLVSIILPTVVYMLILNLL